MATKRTISIAEAERVGTQLGVTWNTFDVKQFKIGMEVELEHGTANATTNVTNDNLLITGKIALAHLNEIPDYYTRLLEMERNAEAETKDR